MPEPVVADKSVEAPKASPIKMGQSLSSQSAMLTKLLQEAPEDEGKPKNDTKIEEPKKEEDKPAEQPKPEETPPPAPQPEPEQPAAPAVELGPIEKFVLDKLPTLSVVVKDGESFKTLKFKDTSDLPADFEIANDAARAQFTADISAQTSRARDAINEYKQTELNNNVKAYEAQEAKDVASDLASLQKQGVIPKFELSEDDPKFNDDPAVKTANQIYDLFKQANQRYMQQGKTYRITYADAADKFFASQTRADAAKAADESQKGKDQPKEIKKEKTPAQKEREQIASKQGAPSGGDAKAEKPRVRAGMTMGDINQLIARGRI